MPSQPLPLTGATLDKAKKYQPSLQLPSGEAKQLKQVWVRAVQCHGNICFLYIYEWVISHITWKTVKHMINKKILKPIKKWFKKWFKSIRRSWVKTAVTVVVTGVLTLLAYVYRKVIWKWVLAVVTVITWKIVLVVVIIIIIVVIIYYYYRHEWDYEPVIVCIEGDTIVCVCFDAGHYAIGKLDPPPQSPPINLLVVPGTHNFEPGGSGGFTTTNFKELTKTQLDLWEKQLNNLPTNGNPILSLEGAFEDPCDTCENQKHFTKKTTPMHSVPR